MRSILLVSIFAAVSAIRPRAVVRRRRRRRRRRGPVRPGRDRPRDGRRLRLPAERRRLEPGRAPDGRRRRHRRPVRRLHRNRGEPDDRGRAQRRRRHGAVYAFERAEDGTWRQTAKLVAPERAPDDQFGVELGFDGELALASKADGDSTTGTVYAFRRQADGSWQPAGTFRRRPASASTRAGAARWPHSTDRP